MAGTYPITIDNFDLQIAAWNVETLGGRRNAPTPRAAEIQIPGRSGHVVEFDECYEAGQIILKMWVIGCDSYGTIPAGSSQRKEFDKNVDLLFSAFSGSARALRTVRQTMGDGSVRAAQVYVSDVISPDMFGPESASFSVAMTIPDSFWYEETDTTQTFTDAAAGGGIHPLTSFAGSTAPLGPIRCLVTGPITNPRITDASGKWIQMTGTVSAGDQWLFDTGTRVSRKGTGLTLASADTAGSDVFVTSTTFNSRYRMLDLDPQISSGVVRPQVTLTGSSTNSSTALSIRTKRRFL